MEYEAQSNLFPDHLFEERTFIHGTSVSDAIMSYGRTPSNIDFGRSWRAVRTSDVGSIFKALNIWHRVRLIKLGETEGRFILPPISGTVFIHGYTPPCGPRHRKFREIEDEMRALSTHGTAYWFHVRKPSAYAVWRNGNIIRIVYSDEDGASLSEFGARLDNEPKVRVLRRDDHEDYKYMHDIDIFEFADAMEASPIRVAPLADGETQYCWAW